MLPIKTVLYPTDFSERSDPAFRVACALARDYGARLLVLHVIEPPLPIYGDGLVLPPAQTDRQSLRARLAELVRRDPTIPIDGELVEGDAAIEILQFADECRCDLIVMGTHGRTGLARALMGSVAEQVTRKARCPVLTVKTPVAESVPAERPARAAVTGTAND